MAREYVKFKRYRDKFDKDFIQKELNKGLTVKMISDVVDIPERRLGEMVKHYGLTVKSKNVIHIINHNYFDNIDTEEKAYFLGFLVADGCISKSIRKSGFESKRICFYNSIQDREIIEKFRDIICPTVEIKWKDNSTQTIKRKNQSSFKFTSEHMFDTLFNKYGIRERKTYDINFKMTDFGIFTRHFIRGFMDGDGNFSKNSLGFIFTSVIFMEQIREFFIYKGFSTRIYKEEGKTIDYYRLIVNINNKNINKIYNILYKDATIYLNRKKELFQEKLNTIL